MSVTHFFPAVIWFKTKEKRKIAENGGEQWQDGEQLISYTNLLFFFNLLLSFVRIALFQVSCIRIWNWVPQKSSPPYRGHFRFLLTCCFFDEEENETECRYFVSLHFSRSDCLTFFLQKEEKQKIIIKNITFEKL